MMMSQKRLPEDHKALTDCTGVDDCRRKVPRLKRVVNEVMKMRSIHHMLEPLIRRVVKEEIEVALKKHLNTMTWSCAKEVYPVELRYLRLQFLNSLCLPVFTGARIEGEGCSPVRLALVDAQSGEVVRLGPESAAKVEIVVLEGDFDGDAGKHWTYEEFKNNIVREREGKKPLLAGDLLLNLKEGIGIVGEISFTDNSSWTRSRRFRLGARVVDDFDGIRIREAKTESFIVRDHRGELYKKHHPPYLYDEVWRLEKIGKDGAFHKRLNREKIFAVKDFLTLLILDPTRLRNILGTGMSAKMWEVTVEHARTCVLDKRLYLYYLPGSQKKSGVIFNIVGQLMGVLSDCQYVAIDKLSDLEKVDAQNMVVLAYQHWEEVISVGDEFSLTGSSSQPNDATCTSDSPMIESPGLNNVASQEIDGIYHVQPTSPIYSLGGMSSLDDFALHGIGNMTLDQTLGFPGQVENPLVFDTGSMTQTYLDKDDLQFFDSDSSIQSHNHIFDSPADLQCAVDGFLHTRSAAVKIDKAQRRWTKLFSVLKWFSVRKTVRTRSRQIRRYNYAF